MVRQEHLDNQGIAEVRGTCMVHVYITLKLGSIHRDRFIWQKFPNVVASKSTDVNRSTVSSPFKKNYHEP